MNRRLEKLEAVLPENIITYRVLFMDECEPAPAIFPPLKANEHAVFVRFVRPRGRSAHI